MANAGLMLLQVLTFNIWGVPDVGFQVVSPLREERIAAICERLREGDWDVVLLQEAWIAKDRRSLEKCGYKYIVDMDNARMAIDSGLMILSKHPVQEKDRLTYPTSTSLSTDGEDLARKSAIIAKIQLPDGPVWVANTHLVSNYDKKNDKYLGRRRRQLEAFAAWAKRKAGSEPLVVGGDLNIDLKDPLWKDVGEQFKGFVEAPESAKACTLCPPNTMHRENEGKVDHLLASPGSEAKQGAVAMEKLLDHDGLKISLSDHLGWGTTFALPPK